MKLTYTLVDIMSMPLAKIDEETRSCIESIKGFTRIELEIDLEACNVLFVTTYTPKQKEALKKLVNDQLEIKKLNIVKLPF